MSHPACTAAPSATPPLSRRQRGVHSGSAAAAPAVSAEAGVAAAAAEPSEARRSKKTLPLLPFAFKLHYGEGALPLDPDAPTAAMQPVTGKGAQAAANEASPYLLFDCSSSTPDVPIIPFPASALQLRLRFLLFPAYKRGDVGSFISSLRAVQVASHYLFGWQVWQLRGEAGQRSVGGVAYPELHVRLWANPSLPSNLQMVGAQRVMLARLPALFSGAFGNRDISALIRAAVQSVYMKHGVPAHFEDTSSAPTGAQQFVAMMGAHFPESFAQLLSALQHFLASRTAEEEQCEDALLSTQEAAAKASATPAAQDAPVAGMLSAMAAMAPASSAADDASDGAAAASSAVPFRFALRHPLLAQLPRSWQSSLALLKKSVAYISHIQLQVQDEGRMGVHSVRRHVRLKLSGADFAAFYSFLQHGLPSVAADGAPVSASSILQRLPGATLFAEWLGILHALPQPAVANSTEEQARQLVQRMTLANMLTSQTPAATPLPPSSS